MKFFISMVAWLVIGHATAFANPIRVTIVSTDFESAKLSGFRQAIQVYSGSVVVSNIEVNNSQLIKNEILNYSAGYVDKFHIVSQQQSGNNYLIVMDVWVAESKIANRILGVGNSINVVNGNEHHAQLTTYRNSRIGGDQILNSVLEDFPKKAFTISNQGYSIQLDNYRNAYLVLPVEIKWNYNYIEAFDEAVKLLSVNNSLLNNGYPAGRVTIMAKKPENILFGFRNVYQMNDLVTYEKIKNRILYNNPVALLEIKDINNTTILKRCFEPENIGGKTPFYSVRENFSLFGNTVEKSFINLKLNASLEQQIKNMSKFELSIVNQKECQ